MKSKFLGFFALIISLFSLSFLSSCGEATVDNSRLVIGMECGYQPFNWTVSSASEYTLPIYGTNEFADGYDIQIAKYLSEDLLNKIPKEFIDNIKENMSTSYILKYDNTKGINEQNLKQETRAILSVIYRDYICDENIKKEIIQKDRKEWFDLETKKEHGNIEVFPQKPIKNLNTKENKALQVVKKQNIIIKIIEKIKIMWRKIRG